MADTMIQHTIKRFFTEHPPDWLVDVGVGMGKEAHELSELWPKLDVLGLEPNAETLVKVAEDYPGLLLNCGVWRFKVSMLLHQPESNPQQASVYAHYPNGRMAEFDALDSICEANGCSPDNGILWLDIEGAELEALFGAEKMLSHGCFTAINLEERETPLWPGACTARDLELFLKEFGYTKRLTYNRHQGEDPHQDAVYTR
jgi:FkbM family methyltransferase